MAERDDQTCLLCGGPGPLRRGHVVPSFAVRWIKETSATGLLRRVEKPLLPAQDAQTARMLCAQCEQRFSAWENVFAQKVFYPWQRGNSTFPYDRWLLQFAVSLAWRTLVTTSRKVPVEAPQHQSAIQAARRQWAAFLLDKVHDDGRPYRHNLFLGKEVAKATEPIPKMQFYLGRAVDATLVVSQAYAAAYTKLPGMIFWSHIVPPDPGGWAGTKIKLTGTFRARGQRVSDAWVGQFLVNRIRMISQLPTSPARQQKLVDKLAKDPHRLLASDSYRAHLAEMRLKYGVDGLSKDVRRRRTRG